MYEKKKFKKKKNTLESIRNNRSDKIYWKMFKSFVEKANSFFIQSYKNTHYINT